VAQGYRPESLPIRRYRQYDNPSERGNILVGTTSTEAQLPYHHLLPPTLKPANHVKKYIRIRRRTAATVAESQPSPQTSTPPRHSKCKYNSRRLNDQNDYSSWVIEATSPTSPTTTTTKASKRNLQPYYTLTGKQCNDFAPTANATAGPVHLITRLTVQYTLDIRISSGGGVIFLYQIYSY